MLIHMMLKNLLLYSLTFVGKTDSIVMLTRKSFAKITVYSVMLKNILLYSLTSLTFVRKTYFIVMLTRKSSAKITVYKVHVPGGTCRGSESRAGPK